jgi:hypothetical protein
VRANLLDSIPLRSFEFTTLFPHDFLLFLNLFTGLKLVAGRFEVLLHRQGCSID